MASGIGRVVTAELVRRSVAAVTKGGGVSTLFRESSFEDTGDYVIPQPGFHVIGSQHEWPSKSHLLIRIVGRAKNGPYLGTVQREVLAATQTRHRPCLFYS